MTNIQCLSRSLDTARIFALINCGMEGPLRRAISAILRLFVCCNAGMLATNWSSHLFDQRCQIAFKDYFADAIVNGTR